QLLPMPGLFPTCPAECQGKACAGRECSVRECQAKQVAAFVEARHTGPEPAILAGDFNAKPDPFESTYGEFTGRGWLDSHVAAGHAECAPDRGPNCTAGREAAGGALEHPPRNVDERIDYIFAVPAAPCAIQKQGTGLFADEPNPFLRQHEQCGPVP